VPIFESAGGSFTNFCENLLNFTDFAGNKMKKGRAGGHSLIFKI